MRMTAPITRFTKLMSVVSLAIQINLKTKTASVRIVTQSFLVATHADTMSSMTMSTAMNAQRTQTTLTEKL